MSHLVTICDRTVRRGAEQGKVGMKDNVFVVGRCLGQTNSCTLRKRAFHQG